MSFGLNMSDAEKYYLLREVQQYALPMRTSLSRKQRTFFDKLLKDAIDPKPSDFISIEPWYINQFQHGGYQVSYGSFQKPGKAFPGDFSYACPIGPDHTLVVEADGATMMVPPEIVREQVLNVANVCTYRLPKQLVRGGVEVPAGSEVFLADNLWIACLARYLHAENLIESPFKSKIDEFFSKYSYLDDSSELVRDTSKSNAHLLPEKLYIAFSSLLYRFNIHMFGVNVTPENSPYFPSGVLSVGVLSANGEYKFAYRGDMQIGHYSHLSPSQNLDGAILQSTDSVGLEDYLANQLVRNKVVLTSQDYAELAQIHRIRRKDTGNLQGVLGHPDDDDLPDIDPLQLEGIITVGDGLILISDGMCLKYHPGITDRRSIPVEGDETLTLAYRNPHLFLLDLIHEQRRYLKLGSDRFYGPGIRKRAGNWRADDASYVKAVRIEH
ncbi:MAG: hypothetical protein V1859_06340 [archaeon]